MCGRITQPGAENVIEEISAFFERPVVVGKLAHLGPKLGDLMTPGKTINVVLESTAWTDPKDSGITLTSMHWGYPSGDESRPWWYNARIETADVKPTWRDDYENRRCLIPVSTFNEGDVIFSSFDDAPLFIAGIFTRQSHRVNEANLRDISMLTKASVGQLKNYSDRSPVICSAADGLDWLKRNSVPNAIRTSVMAYRPRMIVVG